MDDMLKKLLNTGVGFLSQGNKRMQAALDKLVQESKISEQEGKKIMDDLRKSGESKRKDLEKQLQDLTTNLRDRVGLSPDPALTPAPKAKAASAKKAAARPAKNDADKLSAAAAKAGSPKPKKAPKLPADDSNS
jgi:polyhydroxyalkanoate synthesis regulator phasin